MKAGIEIRDRTTYSWRHSFATMLKHLDRAAAQEMLGRRKELLVTDVYDYRTAETRIRTIRESAICHRAAIHYSQFRKDYMDKISTIEIVRLIGAQLKLQTSRNRLFNPC